MNKTTTKAVTLKNSIATLICFIIVVTANAQLPVFSWAKSVGARITSGDKAIALDASGNVYLTGDFYGTVDFDPGVDTFNLQAKSTDIFIAKFSATGNFLWAKSISGTGDKYITAISLDAAGNVYATGHFWGTTDFDPGANVVNLTNISGGFLPDIFILKLDALGNFKWAKNTGGTNTNYGSSLATTPSGEVYTIGRFNGTTDFDPGADTVKVTSAGVDLFITKFDTHGNFLWVKNVGGAGVVQGSSVSIDAAKNLHITGTFMGTADFDPGAGVVNLTSASVFSGNIFILKLDSAAKLVWAKNMEKSVASANSDYGSSIKVDPSGNVYTVGGFGGSVDFDPGVGVAHLDASPGSRDVFISKLDAAGNFVWAKSLGAEADDGAASVVVDPSGNTYVTGYYALTVDFDPGVGTHELTSVSNAMLYTDVFILKLDASANFSWVKSIGGPLSDQAYALALDNLGNVYTAGRFSGTADFNPDAEEYKLTVKSAADADVFVQKMTLGSSNIKENELAGKIEIYPNPASGFIKIAVPVSAEPTTIELYNCLGALVYRIAAAKELSTVDLSNYNSGIYFIKVTVAGRLIGTKKMLKQ